MNRPDGILTRGSLIVTHATLGDTEGMLVGSENLAQRRASAQGRLGGPVAGHLGAVYWVNHGDASGHRAAYRVEEIELVSAPPVTADTTQLDTLRGRSKSRQPEEAPSVRTFAGALLARIEGFFAAHRTAAQGEATR